MKGMMLPADARFRGASKSNHVWCLRGSHSLSALLMVGLALVSPGLSSAAELKVNTLAAFARYVQLSETAMQTSLLPGLAFLEVDRLSPNQRQAALTELRKNAVWIEKLETLDEGKAIRVPNGMIHDWSGTVFVPGVTLRETLQLVQDYDNHEKYYRPDVVRSRILRHEGNHFVVYYRLCRKRIVGVVLDTDHDVEYHLLDGARAWSVSRTTRVQEVENPGKADERLDPPGEDHGFLWRMNSYWRFEQKDGGTYIECRSISLTRDIPTGLGWMIEPFVTSIPRESLTFTLGTTRVVLLEQFAVASAR
jgi:hypothetical protein